MSQLVDELTPIAQYLAQEMTTNLSSKECVSMAQLNATSGRQCFDDLLKEPWWVRLLGFRRPEDCVGIEAQSRAAALLAWTAMVRQDGPWDHKPKLAKRFPSPSSGSFAWHRYGARQYYYDVWSNLHYGYVGTASGFSESVLLDGAGLEQIGTDLLRLRFPKGASGVKGLRRFDDFSDRVAIGVGIDLHRLSPKSVSAATLVKRVTTTAGITSRAVPATQPSPAGSRTQSRR